MRCWVMVMMMAIRLLALSVDLPLAHRCNQGGLHLFDDDDNDDDDDHDDDDDDDDDLPLVHRCNQGGLHLLFSSSS